MINSVFYTEIQFVTGVGPQKAKLLQEELGIFTIGDLLYSIPIRYVDKTKVYTVSELIDTQIAVQLKGKLLRIEIVPGKQKRLVAHFSDGTGVLELVWFKGITWLQKSLKYNTEYIIFGKPGSFNGKLNIIHPEIAEASRIAQSETAPIQAIYSSSEKLKNKMMGQKFMNALMHQTLSTILPKIEETLPQYLIESLQLMPLRETLYQLHFPASMEALRKVHQRIKFEEIFFIQLRIQQEKQTRTEQTKGFIFNQVGPIFHGFYDALPYTLTQAQKRVMKEIRNDFGKGSQMNRLLQGDVGSGKTVVALMCMLIAADNQFQSCMMAPTEILAQQHFKSVSKLVEHLPIRVALLTGSSKASERKEILTDLATGEIHILIGTHALIEERVKFKNVGLVIIDEQHRFGVDQRSRLWTKNEQTPHVLVMSATPIPRTLTMTVYGDLDVSVIDELPPGRKPITTMHYTDASRFTVFKLIKEQISIGHQVYVVFPLINDSEALDYKNLQDGVELIEQHFPPPQYITCVVHGKLKTEVKEANMQRFVKGQANIMVATTVIEVGVDVPNASTMIIESAERFGLAQLHQLRGRVGRGAAQSFCVLMSGYKLSHEAKVRLETMCRTNNGFEIAEVDLQLRGPGDIEGTQQSGTDIGLKLTNLARDGQMIDFARRVAERIIKEDSYLLLDKHVLLRTRLKEIGKNRPIEYRKIS